MESSVRPELQQFYVFQPSAAVCVTVGLFIVQQIWSAWRSRPRAVPIVKAQWIFSGVPFFGILPVYIELVRAVIVKDHLNWACRLHEQFGRTFAVRPSFSRWWIMTTRPENVEHILSTNFQNYPKGSFVISRLTELLGAGIINADGEEWWRQRKAACKMFTAKLFKEHIWSVVRSNARKLRSILTESVESRKVVDVYDLMNRFTLDTIAEIGFGKCVGSLEDPSSPFLQSFDKAQQISFNRFLFAGWQLLRWQGLGFEKYTREHFDNLDRYARKVVRQLRSSIAREGDSSSRGVGWVDIEARKSFVGLFLEDAASRGEALSEDFLRDLVLNFLIAGRDTTAQALSWTLYCLCMHPEVETKARKEISEVCGVRGPVYEDMDHLPYLQAVLNEVLRLYPSVPLDAKLSTQDDTLPDGTFVPGGTAVFWNIFAMGRDIAIWGPDACEFRPDRWLQMKQPPSSFEYPVFNAGPRECMGKRLALIEIKTCLAMLLPFLSFELAVPAEFITTDGQLTIGMANGLPCYVRHVGEREGILECGSSTVHDDSRRSSKFSVSQSEWASTVSEGSEHTSATSECSEGTELDGSRRLQKSRRSGRTRQREKHRRRMATPSPDAR